MGDLDVQGLTKRYGDSAVVNSVSFSVTEGEFFVLLGPSGGGKSTLLRMICGLEQPDEGRVVLAERDITHMAPRRRNIGMVFQDYGLYPHMNVYQNIAYGLEARRMPRIEVDKRVRDAARKLGLTPLIERNVVDLSGGEQQRVALARALAKDADLYLFDEPISNLDPKLRSSARRDIVQVHREKHRPSVYVTHDQTEALAIGDRIGIISKGRLEQVGVADELIQSPANLFVAGFIGSPPMNLLQGTVAREGDRFSVRTDGLALSLPVKWNAVLGRYYKRNVVIGFRPSAVVQEGMASEFEVRPENVISGVVDDVEPLIGETVVTLNLSDQVSLLAVFQGFDVEVIPGQTLRIGIDVDRICLFDPDTEQALAPTQ